MQTVDFTHSLMVFSHSLRCSLLPTVFQLKTGLQTPKLLLLLGTRPPSPNTPMLWPTLLTTQATTPSVHAIPHNSYYPSNFSLVTMKRCNPPNTAHSPSTITTKIEYTNTKPTPPTIPTTSWSTQPFCHNTECRQTDRPTDGIERMFHHVSHLHSLIFFLSFFLSIPKCNVIFLLGEPDWRNCAPISHSFRDLTRARQTDRRQTRRPLH